jgi:hypothetical protein
MTKIRKLKMNKRILKKMKKENKEKQKLHTTICEIEFKHRLRMIIQQKIEIQQIINQKGDIYSKGDKK